MCEPRQRGAYVSQKCGSNLPEPKNPVIDYCAHCLNGGSKGVVAQHLQPAGWFLYEPLVDFTRTATRAGLCGDVKGNNDHMIGGTFVPSTYGGAPIVAHWKTGSMVDFTAEIDTNHNGYFEFYLCDLDACGTKDITGECFLKNNCYKLLRVKHKDCENPSPKTHTECGPVDEKYPGRWYLPCRATEHVGIHIVGGASGTMRYQLPKGVSCDHCVVQWYWATANSCNPRGFAEYMVRNGSPFGTTCPSDGGGLGAYNTALSECGGTNLPEEFWSCADVKISAKGGSAGGTTSGGKDESGSNDGNSGSNEDEKSGSNNDESDVSTTDENDSDGNDDIDNRDNDTVNGDEDGDTDENENSTGSNGSTNEPESDTSHGDATNNNQECGQEGHSCDEKKRCCENQELVCVLLPNEMSTRCLASQRVGKLFNRQIKHH